MSKPKSDTDQILAALDNLHTRLEDIFILQASIAGVTQQQIRAILGIDMARVSRIARHVKEEK
jgi:DNA-directed RNA polymerase specialized sigma24 family protein